MSRYSNNLLNHSSRKHRFHHCFPPFPQWLHQRNLYKAARVSRLLGASMAFNLERNDYLFSVGGAITVLVASFAAQMVGVSPRVELPIDVVAALVTLAGVYFIYKTIGTYGGDVGRYLAVIGVGLAYYALTFIPHIQMHIYQMMNPEFTHIGPVSLMSIYMFQHIATIWVFVLTAYGFYLFWRGGQQ